MHFYSALVFLVLALIWFGYELGWGGGGTMKMHKDVSEQVEAEYEKWLAAAAPAPESYEG